MVLKLEDKKTIVNEVADIASRSISAGVADYRGLTVAEMTSLRNRADKAGVYLKVVRNTLAKRAVENTSFACIQDVLKGPVLLAFTKEDPGAVARLLRDFIKECEKLTVCGLSIGGKLLPAKDLETMAKLPTREQALANLMLVMLAPVTKFVRTMAEPYAMLVRTVAQVRDRKNV